MAKRFLGFMVILGALAAAPQAFADSFLISITKANKAKQGVAFTLTAERVSDTSVLVRMEIPKTGKLKDLKRVKMDIGVYPPGVATSPQLSADLHTTAGKDGSLIVSFQLSPEMAEKCFIHLGPLAPAEPMNYGYYSVELKGYATVRK